MDLEIYDKNYELLGVLDNFELLKWNRRYYIPGKFEITCPLTTDNLELLKKGNIIYKSGDEAGFIDYRNIKLSSLGNEVLYIKGEFLTGFLGRRIIWDQLCYTGTVEGLCRKIVEENCINPKNLNRRIPLLSLGALKNFSEAIEYQNSYGNIINELEGLSRSYGMGYKVKFNYDLRMLEFEVYKGLDRTDSQNINDKALFSRQYENILEQDYIESLVDYRNTALIAGEGEGTNRKMASIEKGIGLERYEFYVDARDLRSTKQVGDSEVVIPDNEYTSMLTQRGYSKLEEHKEVLCFDSVINTSAYQESLIYKTDYDLGDIVTVYDEKWNITVDTRITEVEEIYQNSGMSINVIFGNDMPTIYNKIKRM